MASSKEIDFSDALAADLRVKQLGRKSLADRLAISWPVCGSTTAKT